MFGWLLRTLERLKSERARTERADRQDKRIEELTRDNARQVEEIEGLTGDLQASRQAEAKSHAELQSQREESQASELNIGWESESILIVLSKNERMNANEMAAAINMPKTSVRLACRELAVQGFISPKDSMVPENRDWQITERGRIYLDLRNRK